MEISVKKDLSKPKCLVSEKDCDKNECCYFHPFIAKHCAFTGKNKICPIDNLPCNSSAYKGSSLYDCRHDYGFETRLCKGEEKRVGNLLDEVEVDRFDLSAFSFTVEQIDNKYFLVVKKKVKK